MESKVTHGGGVKAMDTSVHATANAKPTRPSTETIANGSVTEGAHWDLHHATAQPGEIHSSGASGGLSSIDALAEAFASIQKQDLISLAIELRAGRFATMLCSADTICRVVWTQHACLVKVAW